MSEQQGQLTGASTKMAAGLQGKLDVLEAQLEKSQESARLSSRHLASAIRGEGQWSPSGGCPGVRCAGVSIAPSIRLPAVGSALGAVVGWFALWIQLTHWRGRKLEAIREWPVHASLGRWRVAIWTTAGAVVLGVASNRIYDALKS